MQLPDVKKIQIGWREWISLPDLGIRCIKVKIDTGARTSALHVTHLRSRTDASGQETVKFRVYPDQYSVKNFSVCESPVKEYRWVRNSAGFRTLRPVIRTTIQAGEISYKAEITLINRKRMRFRMLLGRTALQRHFTVFPGKSFLLKKCDP